MTQIEFLTVGGAILFGIIFPVAALLMGYDLVWVVLAIPVGGAVGTAIGVALIGPVMRATDRLPPGAPRKKLGDRHDENGDESSGSGGT